MAPESGLTGFDYADCEFKKAVIKQCSEIIVGLTSDKIPAAARFVVAASSDIDVLVVERISVANIALPFSSTIFASIRVTR